MLVEFSGLVRTLSILVTELLRLVYSDLLTSMDKGCKKFSADMFLLSSSRLPSRQPVDRLH